MVYSFLGWLPKVSESAELQPYHHHYQWRVGIYMYPYLNIGNCNDLPCDNMIGHCNLLQFEE